ncbi:MAG: HAD hydrolase-like protein [Patulibacter minatonensis]
MTPTPLRKPNPGMLRQLAEEHDLDLARSVAVGDRWRDVEAGRRAGVRTLFIDRGWDEQQPADPDSRGAGARRRAPLDPRAARPP